MVTSGTGRHGQAFSLSGDGSLGIFIILRLPASTSTTSTSPNTIDPHLAQHPTLNFCKMSGLIKAFMRPKQPARPSSAQTLVTTPSTSPDQHDLEAGETHTGEVGEVEVRKLEQENHLLQQQLRKAEQKYAALKKQVAELEKDLRKECSDKNASREEAKTFYSKVLSLKKENASLNRELKECQGRLDSSIVDLRKAQLSSFKQSQTGWFVEEDSRIHESLAQFYKDVRLWAKTYCLKSLETFCDVDDHTRSYLSNAVLGVASFQEWDDFCKFKHPFLILAALVSETLRSWMFGDYFYIFVRPGDPSDNGATRMALLETFNKLLTGMLIHLRAITRISADMK